MLFDNLAVFRLKVCRMESGFSAIPVSIFDIEQRLNGLDIAARCSAREILNNDLLNRHRFAGLLTFDPG